MRFYDLIEKMTQQRIDHPLLNTDARKMWFLGKIFLLVLWMAWIHGPREHLYEILEVSDDVSK